MKGRVLGVILLCLYGCGDGDDDESGGVEEVVESVVTPDAAADTPEAPEVSNDALPSDDEPEPVDTPGEPADLPTHDPGPEPADEGTPEDVVPDPPEVDVDAADAVSTIGEKCFEDIYDAAKPGPDYDQYAPVVGEHCFGTNHQDIKGVERVVFLGDSVTVGTPNASHLLSVDNAHFYRNLLAEWLAEHFELDRGELIVSWGTWKAYDYFTGKGTNLFSGDFANCSKWGARTDDLMSQSAECFPEGTTDKKTLVVFTMGGNDLSKLAQKGGDATPEEVEAGYPEAWKVAEDTILHLETALAWLTDPENFPNGSYVIFANPFEFTDGTGNVDSCTPQSKLNIPGIGEIDLSDLNVNVAALAGYKAWANPAIQEEMVVWILEEYMRVTTEYGVDMVWMLEKFCGHGYVAAGKNADPENRCYLGPDTPLWFDETCTHPNPDGHLAISEMFKALILE